MNRSTTNQPRRQLSRLDAISIIVGIIIGAGIFETTPDVAAQTGSVVELLLIWSLGGLITLLGALCFAELAAAYPHAGGIYVYLSKAFGQPLGVFFAWCEFWVVRPGSIGAMAFIFARYAEKIAPVAPEYRPTVLTLYTCSSVLALTTMNLVGVRCGKWTQNILTLVKVFGLGLVVVAAFALPRAAAAGELAVESAAPAEGGSLALALILVFFTYGGWNEVAYVAAEVKQPEVNLPRSLLAGALIVWAIYLLVNLAFLWGLGLEGMRNSSAVGVDVVTPTLGAWGGRAVSALVCISCLGAVNGMILTGARIHYALGAAHPLFRFLGRWSDRWDAPLWSLTLQGLVTVGLVVLVASEKGFERLVMFTAPVFWLFMLLVGLALMVLRRRDANVERPYRVIGYPVTPLLFCGICGYVVYSSGAYLYKHWPPEAAWGLGIIAVGVAVCLYRPHDADAA